MTYSRILLSVVVLVFVSACADYRYMYRRPPPPPVVVKPPLAQTKPLQRSEVYTPELASPVKRHAPTQPLSPAVVALMSEAESDRRVGNLDSAVATIERALRIQPRNATLWHQLAAMRMDQDKPRLALDLAKKSNTLVGGNRELMRKNWLLIADARRMLGDAAGAERALLEADR